MGVIVGILGSLFGFPVFVPWGLVNIFNSRVPIYGWGGPNNTAVMMVGDVVLFAVSVALFTVLIGYFFLQVREKTRLASSAFILSVIAHGGAIIASLVFIKSCHDGCDMFGESMLVSFASVVYFILGAISGVLLWLDRRKRAI